jgi:ABC-type spermidine/putrescine transport system permease subunit II
VVYLFIRNWRVTIIAGLAIPTSIVGTFLVMRALDFTLNNMTMLALSLAIGIVIDDAIVVLENIFRYIEEMGATPRQAAIDATAEIGLAVMATTLSLVVIFVPVAFMTGQVGRYFYSFGIPSATAIMLVTAVVWWVVVRSKLRGRALLDALASLPIVFPGLVLGHALMVFYLHVDVGVYGTLWILFIAYVTRFLPYGIRYNTASMLGIHRELEESAAVSGASWWTTFRLVVLPLLRPGFIAGWIYIAIVAIRELSSSILLYAPGSEVLSVVIWELWENGQYVELSALGVLITLALFALVMIAQPIAGRLVARAA